MRFFTVNLLERRLDTLVRHVDVLREAVRVTRLERPFHIDAWVVLPDHLHCVWTLPPGDADFSNRWKAIKIRFVRAIPATERRSKVRVAKGERGVWQRRFWEHAIRDEVVGYIKGKSAISVARQFSGRQRNFNGESLWARGYAVSTVGFEELNLVHTFRTKSSWTAKVLMRKEAFRGWILAVLGTANNRQAPRYAGAF